MKKPYLVYCKSLSSILRIDVYIEKQQSSDRYYRQHLYRFFLLTFDFIILFIELTWAQLELKQGLHYTPSKQGERRLTNW